jgi:AcrR family transcriptional regulator
MARRKKTRDRIIEGAARVFSDKGFEGATTREIAEAAGVNEVTLFRHFGTKKSIFLAVIDRFSALPGLEAAMQNMVTGDVRRDLTRLGTHFLQTMITRRKEIIMSLQAADRLPEIREAIALTPQRQNRLLADYLRDQIKRGAVRRLPDPDLAAEVFFGMLFERAVRQWLVLRESKKPLKTVVSRYVDIFLRGTIGIEEGK